MGHNFAEHVMDRVINDLISRNHVWTSLIVTLSKHALKTTFLCQDCIKVSGFCVDLISSIIFPAALMHLVIIRYSEEIFSHFIKYFQFYTHDAPDHMVAH